MTVEEWLGKENKVGIDIWDKKYRWNDESFDQWLDRVSGGNPSVRDLIISKKFLFAGRILANRGINESGRKITLSNCYVEDIENDSLESIFKCASNMARTFSCGGGVGVDISKLAPKGAKVRNAAKTSSGAVSFMDLYSLVTNLISQNGRRGALMLSMSCDHPDIEEFIDIKNDLDKISSANISVRVTDEFMSAVCKNEPFELSFTRPETGEVITKVVDARKVIMRLAENNWKTGEPGCLFWDRITRWNLLSGYDDFSYAGVNPCAEEPLPASGNCLLGSLNLSEFVLNPFTSEASIDNDALLKAVRTCIRALDEVLDEGIPLHPLEAQRKAASDWRQIGLGIMGLGDMLIKLGIKYGSNEAVKLCDKLGFEIAYYAIIVSSVLGKELGSFPMFNADKTCSSAFYLTHMVEKKVDAMRNSQLLTIAPTGSISTMIGCSGGIEPIFANSYTRTTKSLHGEDMDYKIYTPIVKEYMTAHGIGDESQLPPYFVTARDISWKNRIAMQAAWQDHVDASISSTINLPHETTVKDVFKIYCSAWANGLKGVTVFREGCDRAAILNTGDEKPVKKEEISEYKRGEIAPAHDDCIGLKRTLKTGCGTLHCQAWFDTNNGELREVFLEKGSTGGCNSFMNGLSRMMSIGLRAGIKLEDIVDQLNSTMVCPAYSTKRAVSGNVSLGASCPSAVGKALIDMCEQIKAISINMGEQVKPASMDKWVARPQNKKGGAVQSKDTPAKCICPNCGEPALASEGGCVTCKLCGYTKCD